VRQGTRTLVAAIVAALLLAVGLAACGGGSSSSSTAAEGGQGQPEKSSGGVSREGDAKSGGGESGSKGGEGQSGNPSGSASNFVPKHHHDSGGGSQQYRVKGGDNSVQEFGGEADASERDAAALALHGFLDARAEGNWAAACEYLSKSSVESLEKLAPQTKQSGTSSCAAILKEVTNPAAKRALKAEAAVVDVGSLRIEGERAFVIYTGPKGTVIAVPMTNEGGVWKVASLAGTPIA
jgi:hypothetical protein